MARMSELEPIAPDAGGVALNRLRFLTVERTDPDHVRPSILASWHRSRELHVAADRIELPYRSDIDVDTRLTRNAEPVLRRLRDQLSSQSVSIILTDPTGLVLSRCTTDAELERHLDRVLLAPGFSYAEEFVGTNGIGTALEAGAGTEVFGHEHYAENLENLACAGVPIHDPVSGRLVGALDLTCWRRDAQSMLLTVAESTVERIHHAMQADAGMAEYTLLQAYRRTCRRTTGIVFAVTDDALMLNDRARAEVEPADLVALIAHAGEAGARLAADRRRSVQVSLPSGRDARMYCQQVGLDAAPVGLVVHVRLAEALTERSRTRSPASRMLLPGLVGEAPLWQRACQKVEESFAAGTWLVAQGEAGTGKAAILRTVQLRAQPARRFLVIDAAEAATDRHWLTTVRRTLAEDTDSIIVTRVDALDALVARGLSLALEQARSAERARPLWVGLTLGLAPDAPRPELEQLLRLFPETVDVPPLRLRLEDIPPLVTFLLAKLGRGGHITCSAAAMRLLMRSSWPGNVTQLQRVLFDVVQHRRSGVIGADDLPPSMLSMSRHVLTPLESMERDAIVRSLADADGNKVQAARALGMSRATIYRKIHEYGIVAPS